MDNWTEANLLAMLLGGNRQLRSFFRRQKIENSEVEVLYRTKQATYYREQLGAQVERMLDKRRAARPEAGEAPAPAPPAAPPPRAPPRRRRELAPTDFDVLVRVGSLGASLTRALPPEGVAASTAGNGSMALVTKVVTNGLAFSNGVRVGDYVCALNGRPVSDYDEFVAMFARCPRPVRLTVRRFEEERVAEEDPPADAAPPAPAPPPAAQVWEASFGDGPLGLTVQPDPADAAAPPVVVRVAPGGAAAARGVRVGDVVVAVDDVTRPDHATLVARLADAPRPASVSFSRPPEKAKPLRVVVPDALLPRTSPAKRPPDLSPPPRHGPPPAAFRGARVIDVAEDLGSTKLELPADADDDREFDVSFADGPLGMRLEERGGLVALSVVTHVADGGQARDAGVQLGCVVLGVNGERYLSHAHTTATLKHGKRPVMVRLRYQD